MRSIRTLQSLRLLVVVIMTTLVTCATQGQYVERRGGETTLHGELTNVDESGVTLKSDLGAEHFVPWDRVRTVASTTFRDEIARYEEVAVQLWRARSRVERNDPTLAEPIFERLFARYRGRTHETALVVAEGLLRCRIARGAQAQAVIPALEVIRIRRAGVSTISYSHLPDMIDERVGLCTLLPPFWIPSSGLETAYAGLERYSASGDGYTEALAKLYLESIRRVIRPDSTPLGQAELADMPNASGLTLFKRLLDSISDDADVRQRARNALMNTLPSVRDTYVDAWTHFFVGLSLLGETGEVRQQRGMMYLLHLPARFRRAQQYLAGVALATASMGLEVHGHRQAAERLRGDLAAMYPFHPVRDRINGLEQFIEKKKDDG